MIDNQKEIESGKPADARELSEAELSSVGGGMTPEQCKKFLGNSATWGF